ncbi:MAG: hypothetical protein KJ710_06835, partial [Candidatus Omnitrophica bacterium]|nr:hypothetical protein [Candidatus Omnitrophota bacterium]MBU1923950.1 hypothetical protein [Candidatus Omnitrophota bacterium]
MRKKDLIELGITGILLVVLIIAFGNSVKKLHSRNATRPKGVDLDSQSPVAVDKIDSRSLYNLLEQQTKSIELKRDPFTAAPIIMEKNMQAGVALTGILWDKIKPLAIINAEVVKKGSRLDDKVV